MECGVWSGCLCAIAIRLHTLEWATSVKMQIFTNMRTRPEIGNDTRGCREARGRRQEAEGRSCGRSRICGIHTIRPDIHMYAIRLLQVCGRCYHSCCQFWIRFRFCQLLYGNWQPICNLNTIYDETESLAYETLNILPGDSPCLSITGFEGYQETEITALVSLSFKVLDGTILVLYSISWVYSLDSREKVCGVKWSCFGKQVPEVEDCVCCHFAYKTVKLELKVTDS